MVAEMKKSEIVGGEHDQEADDRGDPVVDAAVAKGGAMDRFVQRAKKKYENCPFKGLGREAPC